MALQGEVMLEARDQPITVETEPEQTFIKVEQVAVFMPLKKRSQLGAKKFLRLERDNLGFRLMPVVDDLEGVGFQSVQVLVFPRVHLDLKFERASPSGLWVELEFQMHGVRGCVVSAFPQP